MSKTQAQARTLKPQPLTKEQQEEQMKRFFAQKRESIATAALMNMLANPGRVQEQPEELVKQAIDIADTFIKEFWVSPAIERGESTKTE